jgi:hypothetical protein
VCVALPEDRFYCQFDGNTNSCFSSRLGGVLERFPPPDHKKLDLEDAGGSSDMAWICGEKKLRRAPSSPSNQIEFEHLIYYSFIAENPLRSLQNTVFRSIIRLVF